MTTITILKQMPLKNVKRGEYVRRKLDSKVTFIRGEYERASKMYSLIDADDMNRELFLNGNTPVWVGFTY